MFDITGTETLAGHVRNKEINMGAGGCHLCCMNSPHLHAFGFAHLLAI